VPFDWAFLSDPRLASALAAGLKVTLLLSLCSAVGALLIGILVAVARIAGPAPVQRAARYYTDVARNVPLLITIFFLYFGMTNLFPPAEFTFLRTRHYGEIVMVVAISLVMGGFVSEVIRQGVESVPIGQVEAAMATGLETRTIYRQIVIPQLLPLVLPGLSSEMVNVLKSTTFALTIGVADLMWHAQSIESETFKGVETMTAVSLVYFLLSFCTIAAFRGLERIYRPRGSR
jgi:polar amino acid transport system permease protein